MNKKEYIERAKQCILNRVKFHAPIVYDDEIDKRGLFEKGIDANLPIFKFDRKLTKHLVKAFELAQKEESFNIVFAQSSLENVKEKCLSKLKNVCVFSESDSVKFLKSINKLNINYYVSSNYNKKYLENFVCINGERINPAYDNFSLSKIQYFDGVMMQYNEFVLNGNNMYFQFCNNSTKERKIVLEINFLLKKGYFFIKKEAKSVLFENLLSKEKQYLNYVCENVKLCFSNIDGLQNSFFPCINIVCVLCLKPNQKRKMFFNFGQDKFTLKESDNFDKLLKKAQELSCEIFNVKVKTKNPKFDLLFNKTLPQKIWLNWINQTPDISLEEKYLAYKRMFVRGKKDLSLIPFKQIGLRELGVFNGEYYKKIVVVNADREFFKIGKTIFYNLHNITRTILQSKDPVSLSFG